jgi:hypothetical protein
MLKQRALVMRGVMVRGAVKSEGAYLEVVEHPTSTDEITHQEFAELKSSNYVIAVVEKPHEPLSSQQAAVTQAAMDKTQAKK